MDDPKKIAAYDKSMKQLQKDWKGLSVAKRQQRLAANAKTALGDNPAAFPKNLAVVSAPTKERGNAQYNFDNNALAISKKDLEAPTMTSDEMRELSSTVYHESRHAEQWYSMARLRAAQGQTAAQIQSELGVPKGVAEAAVANPVKPKSDTAACAQKMYDSVYGKDADKRGKTLDGLESNPKKTAAAATASDKAAANYEKLSKQSPPASPADLKKAKADWTGKYADWQKAEAAEKANYKDYRNLPEEHDAWRVEGNSSKAW